MIVDSSAVICILKREADAEVFSKAIGYAEEPMMSAATFFETAIVASSNVGDEGGRLFDDFMLESGIQVIPVDKMHADAARRAYAMFGKGNHKAALNFGDCFAYALAKVSGRPLLFKGNDFSQTDIESAL